MRTIFKLNATALLGITMLSFSGASLAQGEEMAVDAEMATFEALPDSKVVDDIKAEGGAEARTSRQDDELARRGEQMIEEENRHRLRIQALERQISIAEREKRLELERKARREAENDLSMSGMRRDSTMVAPPPPPIMPQQPVTRSEPPPPPPKVEPPKTPNLAGVVGHMAIFSVGQGIIRAQAGEMVEGHLVERVTPSEVVLSYEINGQREEKRISLVF